MSWRLRKHDSCTARTISGRVSCEVLPRIGFITKDSYVRNETISTLRPSKKRVCFERWEVRSIDDCSLFPSAAWSIVKDGVFYLDNSISVGLNERFAGSVYATQRHLLSLKKERVKFRVAGEVFVAGNEGAHTWGHWVVHTLPRVMVFLEMFPSGNVIVPHSYLDPDSSFHQLLLFAGADMDRVISVPGTAEVLLEHLVLIDIPYKDGLPHPAVVEMYLGLGRSSSNVRRGVFSKRLNSEKRNIENFDEVSGLLANSFDPVEVGSFVLDEQISVWRESSVVSGVLGSDFSNIVFGGERVLCLTPEWFGDDFFFGLAAAFKVEWNELWCGKMGVPREPVHASSFHVQPAALGRALSYF